MNKCLVIIPTYNEAQNVEAIVNEVFDVSQKISGWQLHILVVDDNSPDGTSKIVRHLQINRKKLYLLTGPKAGLGKAYLRGFKFGLKDHRFQAFVMMDADFSHNPKAIPSLLKALDRGADYASGSRYVSGGKVTDDWPRYRRQSSRLANLIVRLLIDNHDVADLTSGFKAIKTESLSILDLTKIRATGYVFLVSLLHEISRSGAKIQEVPITFSNRRHGRSKIRVYDVLEFLYLTYRLNPQSRARRLVRFSIVGVSGTIVNLTLLSILVHFKLFTVLTAGAISIEASIISNFCINHLYTFRAAYTSPRTRRRDSLISIIYKLVKYNVIYLVGAVISFGVFVFGYKQLQLHYLMADSLGIVLAMSWNYWLSTKLVWQVVDR